MSADITPLEAMGILLGKAVHDAGGTLECTREEIDTLKLLYGEPAPMVVGSDERGVFAGVYMMADYAERAWPLLARSMQLEEAEARALAATMAEAMHEAQRKINAARAMVAEARRQAELAQRDLRN